MVAADVSSAPGRLGRSGWTWYTGSAGWMYRIWLEEVLGLRVRGAELSVDPVIPDSWPKFEMKYRYRSTTYEIEVSRDASGREPRTGEPQTTEDGQLVAQPVRLIDDGRVHRLTVVLPTTNGEDRPKWKFLPTGATLEPALPKR